MSMITMQIASDFMAYDYLVPSSPNDRWSPTFEVSAELYGKHQEIWKEFRELQSDIDDMRVKHNKNPPKEVIRESRDRKISPDSPR